MEVGSWLFWQLFSKYSTLAWSVWFLPSPYFYASSTSQAQNQESLIQEVSYLNLQASLIMTWQSMLLPPQATENKREATTNIWGSGWHYFEGDTSPIHRKMSIKDMHSSYEPKIPITRELFDEFFTPPFAILCNVFMENFPCAVAFPLFPNSSWKT